MDINKAKENLKGYLNWLKTNGFSMAENDEAIQIILSELDKKDKIINLIGEMLVKDHEWFYSEFDNYTKQDFIEYFTNKVEEDIKE